jgi:hypothetical protein
MAKSSGFFGKSFVGQICLEPALAGGLFSSRLAFESPTFARPALNKPAFSRPALDSLSSCYYVSRSVLTDKVSAAAVLFAEMLTEFLPAMPTLAASAVAAITTTTTFMTNCYPTARVSPILEH